MPDVLISSEIESASRRFKWKKAFGISLVVMSGIVILSSKLISESTNLQQIVGTAGIISFGCLLSSLLCTSRLENLFSKANKYKKDLQPWQKSRLYSVLSLYEELNFLERHCFLPITLKQAKLVDEVDDLTESIRGLISNKK